MDVRCVRRFGHTCGPFYVTAPPSLTFRDRDLGHLLKAQSCQKLFHGWAGLQSHSGGSWERPSWPSPPHPPALKKAQMVGGLYALTLGIIMHSIILATC